MSDFLERFGFVESIVELPADEMPDSLRAGLWDITKKAFFDFIEDRRGAPVFHFSRTSESIWFDLVRRSLDELDRRATFRLLQIRQKFFSFNAFEVYRFIEYMANFESNEFVGSVWQADEYVVACNKVLLRERSSFRFSGLVLVRLTAQQELSEVSVAITNDISREVSAHISRSAELFSQRPVPDYRNSIKESISAVEAAVRVVTGKKTYGIEKPLKLIEEEISIHPALIRGFEKLYAFSSDEGGIRHALMDEPNISEAHARYMLVSCSAFANYLLSHRSCDTFCEQT